MGLYLEQSFVIPDSATSQRKTLDGTARQSDAITSPSFTFFATADCFIRAGANPTVLADGTDMFVPGGNLFRVADWKPGWKVAFITSGQSGTISITPGA